MDGQRIDTLLMELGATVGKPLTVIHETGSTNDDAKAAAADGAPHGAVFIADHQTKGRGRGSNRWHSPPGENVYLSLLLRLALEPEAMSPLSLVVGVGVASVVDTALAEPRARIKWPNDIYVDDHKIAGVLVEAISKKGSDPCLIVGIGLNVLSRRFPADFAVPPTSLDISGARLLDREMIAAHLVSTVGTLCHDYAEAGLEVVQHELQRRDFLRDKRVRTGDIDGIACGIDERGRLLVKDDDGKTHAAVSGEVTWTPNA